MGSRSRATPRRKTGHRIGRWAAYSIPLLVAVFAAFQIAAVIRDPAGPAPLKGFAALRAEAGYETSDGCMVCHLEQGPSWERTFHRTMTQEASDDSVVAPFDGRPVPALGVTSVPRRTEDGAYVIETSHPGTGDIEPFEVVMTVGSRRIQQFVTRVGDRHVRLPVAWSMEEGRWFHLLEAFFHPDGSAFHEHTVYWDYNCIFCHNVKGATGWDPAGVVADEVRALAMPAGFEGTYDARVEEMGIACEACHGPGEEHARRMRSPIRRYVYNAIDEEDPTIVDPKRLSQERSLGLCGHCHGQRLPASQEKGMALLTTGDPYVPGERLADSWETLHRDTIYQGVSFSPRFWRDGSPRLTAYEYQGVLASPCASDASFTCLSCHAMHDGDPRGQIRPDRQGNDMCVSCHSELGGAGLARHSRHDPAGSGSECVSCHMPPEVYGVMTWHPSHLIRNPDPARAARFGKPDACTLCHTGRSIRWAAEKTRELWPGHGGSPEGLDESYDLAELPRALSSGDAVYRTLAAAQLGRTPVDDGVTNEMIVPLLANALLDPYPNVRRTARLSLVALLGTEEIPHALDEEADRRAVSRELVSRPLRGRAAHELGGLFDERGRLDLALVEHLAERRVELPVSIGE